MGIQLDGTIRPEKEYQGDLCLHGANFEWGKAPVISNCDKPYEWNYQWNYEGDGHGHIWQWKHACQFREEGCSSKGKMCWTVKTVGLDRRVVLDDCRTDCENLLAVANQRFIYQQGRVRLVDTDFCVAWY